MQKQMKRIFFTYIIIQLLVTMVYPSSSYAANPNVYPTVVVQGNNVTVSGTVECDKNYFVASMEMVDGNQISKPIQLNSATTWSYTFPNAFSDGKYNYTIKAIAIHKNDRTSSTSSTPITFTVDSTGPTLSIISTSVQKNNVTISGSVSDAVTQNNQITLELLESNLSPVAGVPSTSPDAQGNWSFSFQKTDGIYNLKIKATDDAQTKHSSFKDVSFTVDSTGPTISISSSARQDSNVVISGTVSDIVTASNLIQMELYDSNLNRMTDAILTGPNAQGYWSYSLTRTDGNYNYKIRALDLLNNSTYKDYSFTVDTAGPKITTNSPVFQTDKKITLSGTVSDATTPANQIPMQLLDANAIPITNAIYSAPTATSNQWSYTLPGEFTEGTYNYQVKATNSSNFTTITNYSVTVDNNRPKVSSIKVKVSDKVNANGKTDIDLLPNDVTGYVKTNTPITFTITDDKMVAADKVQNALIVFSSKGVNVAGTIKATKKNDKNLEVVFTPATPLAASTTYYIMINPLLVDVVPGSATTTDAAGNPVYPLIRKFATERGSVLKLARMLALVATNPNANDPHGNYEMNTNTCATCHSTHNASGAKLEQYNTNYSSYNYCMACHDGTGAAAPLNMHQNGHFSEYGKDGVQSSAGECASCHNPHLAWNEENPNLIKDHYVVDNHPAVEGVPADMFDSEKQLCETCHDTETNQIKNYGSQNNIVVTNKIFDYRKSTATGVPDDYALCLRCHDGTRKWKDSNGVEQVISNIQQFFDTKIDEKMDLTNSNLSQHRITAISDGRLVKSSGTAANDGHIPCSECHDTHGSTNIKLLSNTLGLEDRRLFSSGSGDWDAAKERVFCSTCHNGSTAIYGVTGKALDPAKSAGHTSTDPRACSTCHGTGNTAEEKALSAAHAPMQGTP
ncbi:Ig-like domain-containing protein [Neobacillus drentensis]|uniref:Ig-like domain-containing protein n=1 Tax=Neobacillus drentensis TaxID=220684 RepID=UPI003000BBF3